VGNEAKVNEIDEQTKHNQYFILKKRND
jgi:hypothetical protein